MKQYRCIDQYGHEYMPILNFTYPEVLCDVYLGGEFIRVEIKTWPALLKMRQIGGA